MLNQHIRTHARNGQILSVFRMRHEKLFRMTTDLLHGMIKHFYQPQKLSRLGPNQKISYRVFVAHLRVLNRLWFVVVERTWPCWGPKLFSPRGFDLSKILVAVSLEINRPDVIIFSFNSDIIKPNQRRVVYQGKYWAQCRNIRGVKHRASDLFWIVNYILDRYLILICIYLVIIFIILDNWDVPKFCTFIDYYRFIIIYCMFPKSCTDTYFFTVDCNFNTRIWMKSLFVLNSKCFHVGYLCRCHSYCGSLLVNFLACQRLRRNFSADCFSYYQQFLGFRFLVGFATSAILWDMVP